MLLTVDVVISCLPAMQKLTLQQISNESRNNDFTAVEALKVENKQLNRYLLDHLINLGGRSYLTS